MANGAGSHRDQQQRELEEIRRSFLDMGTKMGSLFEPGKHDGDDAGQPAAPAPAIPDQLPTARERPVRVLALVAAACLLLGGTLGFLLHRPATGTIQQRAGPAVTTTTLQAPPQIVAPAACLETARRGDVLIDLYTRNIRDNRLTLALKSYTLASQACRKEASP
jgi:hypothetical protein